MDRGTLPRRLRPHGTPPIIPILLIARLAVDGPLQGQGIGRDLMLAAISRALRAHAHGGGAFIVVDAAGDKAQRLYGHHGFAAIPDTSERMIRMVVRMETAAEMLRVS